MLTCRSVLWSFVVALASLPVNSSSALIGAEVNTAGYNVGDRVEFVSIFGEQKTGTIERVTPLDFVIVETDDGRSEIVKLDKLGRLTTQADNPFASDEEKADLSIMRTWEDSSGTFKVEARMLRTEDGAVVLELNDGKEVTVPLTKLSDADRKFLSGNTTVDEPQVEITPTDLARAHLINISSTSKWRYTPDAAPDVDVVSGESSSVNSAASSALKGDDTQVRFTLGARLDIFEEMAHLLVDTDEKKAFAVTFHREPGADNGYQSRVFACDLVEGGVDAVGNFATGQLPVDMSPDGKWIIAHSSAFGFGKSDVASIFSLAGEEADPVVRWQPFNSGGDNDNDIRWMRFVDDAHVLVVSNAGQTSLWAVPELKPIWATALDRFARRSSATPGLSAGGKVVSVSGTTGIALVEVLTGRKLGHIDADEITSADSQFAFDRTGRRLALVERSRCRVWNLDPPELVRDFAISQRIRPGQLAWVDDDRLLVGGRHLIDVNLRIWLWDFEHASSKVQVRGRTVWSVVSASRHDNWILGANTVPHPEALEIADTLDADELLVVRPGTSMAIELDVDVSVQERQEIEAAIADNLQKSGFSIDADSATRLIGHMSTGPSQDIAYEDLFGFPGGRDVTHHTVEPKTVQLTILYRDQPIWRYSHTKNAPHLLWTRDGESRDQALDREMKQDPIVLGRVRIPTHIAMGTADQPYGSASGVTERRPLQTSAP